MTVDDPRFRESEPETPLPPGGVPPVSPSIQSPADLLRFGLTSPELSATDTPPPTPEDLDVLIPGFKILGLIGIGGMGAVYRAIQEKLDREVALKILPSGLAENPEFGARFQREAQSMARMSHPHVVQVFQFGRTLEGHHYFVMELVDGLDLSRIIRKGRTPPLDALRWAAQSCSALHYAHSKGFIHRDIKPGNIMINSTGEVKITDFGIAKLICPGTAVDRNQQDLTVTGVSLGTPEYMSPEQRGSDDPIDHRSDIYSIGVVLYELLTGRIPRGAFSPISRDLAIDSRIDQILSSAMASSPALRYHDASEMEHAIGHVLAAEKGRSGPGEIYRLPFFSRISTKVLVFACLILAILVLGVIMVAARL